MSHSMLLYCIVLYQTTLHCIIVYHIIPFYAITAGDHHGAAGRLNLLYHIRSCCIILELVYII